MTSEEFLACWKESLEPAQISVAWFRKSLDVLFQYLKYESINPVWKPEEIVEQGGGLCDQLCIVYLWAMREVFGLCGKLHHLITPWGQGHFIVEIAGLVVDVSHHRVYTSSYGYSISLNELKIFPECVACEEPEWTDSYGAKMSEYFSSAPTAVNFLIGDICNAKCEMCWQALRREQTEKSAWRPEMSAFAVQAVVDRYKESLQSVELVSYGETFLSPGFDEMINFICDTGNKRGRPIAINTITNGSLLHKFQKILGLPGYLTVSIDSPFKETYEKIRIGLSWDEVSGNFSRAVQGKRHSERYVGVNMTVYRENETHIYEMAKWLSDLGADYLSILYGDALHKTKAIGKQIDKMSLLPDIERSKEAFPKLKINDYATGRTVVALPSDTLPGRDFCSLPWRQMDIGTDGRVHPCCRSHDVDLGSAMDENVWVGEPYRQLRDAIVKGTLDAKDFPSCAKCPNLGSMEARRKCAALSVR